MMMVSMVSMNLFQEALVSMNLFLPLFLMLNFPLLVFMMNRLFLLQMILQKKDQLNPHLGLMEVQKELLLKDQMSFKGRLMR